MSGTLQDVTFNDTTPAASSGKVNVQWQTDGNGNISAQVPPATATTPGAVPTPPNSTTQFLRGDATWATFSGMTNPMTTAGDIIYENSSPAPARLAIGSTGQVLTVSSGLPAWVTPAITEAELSLSNVTTANSTSSQHGLCPKLSGSASQYLDGTGNFSTPGSSPASISVADIGQRFQWCPVVGSAVSGSSSFGITAWSGTGSTQTVAAGATTSAPFVVFGTASTATNSAGMFATGSAGAGPLSLDCLQSITFVLKLAQTTQCRIWIGLGANGTSANYHSDTVGASQNFVGFRYSAGAGDSKYQCVTGNGSSETITAESTSSHVDATTIHRFTLTWDGTNMNFYIDGTLVGQQSTNVPSASANLFPVCLIDNDGNAVAVSFDMFAIRGQWSGI